MKQKVIIGIISLITFTLIIGTEYMAMFKDNEVYYSDLFGRNVRSPTYSFESIDELSPEYLSPKDVLLYFKNATEKGNTDSIGTNNDVYRKALLNFYRSKAKDIYDEYSPLYKNNTGIDVPIGEINAILEGNRNKFFSEFAQLPLNEQIKYATGKSYDLQKLYNNTDKSYFWGTNTDIRSNPLWGMRGLDEALSTDNPEDIDLYAKAIEDTLSSPTAFSGYNRNSQNGFFQIQVDKKYRDAKEKAKSAKEEESKPKEDTLTDQEAIDYANSPEGIDNNYDAENYPIGGEEEPTSTSVYSAAQRQDSTNPERQYVSRQQRRYKYNTREDAHNWWEERKKRLQNK